jgi:hypothetical protein
LGGSSPDEIAYAVRYLATDVVEVAQAYDHGEITSIAAATVLFDLITLIARGQRAEGPCDPVSPQRTGTTNPTTTEEKS